MRNFRKIDENFWKNQIFFFQKWGINCTKLYKIYGKLEIGRKNLKWKIWKFRGKIKMVELFNQNLGKKKTKLLKKLEECWKFEEF